MGSVNFKQMKNFRSWNLLFGWGTFLVAMIVYMATIEPTASLWDCGEYIATAFKLQVGHPPGAPFWQIIARVASLFAGSDVTQAAKMVNGLSGLVSALTIMFLYWTISHLARKLVSNGSEMTPSQSIGVIAAGLVGSLAYMFSDTFWFSAVEGEVYATSSLFTAMVFWAILKWENVANEKGGDRWIVLIAYLMGLSIGVHLLNLLAIPAIVFVYYFRKTEKVDSKGFILALIISVVLVAVIMYGIILGVFKVSAQIELAFVNTLGLPYNSGVLFHLFLLVGLLIAGVYLTQWRHERITVTIIASLALVLSGAPFMTESVFLSLLFIGGIVWLVYYLAEKKRIMLNMLLLVTTMILLGYSSYALVVIRSYANPPIDENNPENVFALVKYIAREQYGDRPLGKGQYYNAPILETKETKPIYIPKDDKYVISNRSLEYIYDSRFETIFPRMWSAQQDHQEVYKQWGEVTGRPITVGTGENRRVIRVPTFSENLRFMFTYQLGFMYWRYFMWNFAGRQNDIQGAGGPLKGNWLTGISFIDNARLGPQKDLPEYLANNRARNKYYLLPLLLGIAGLLFHVNRKPRDFWVVLLLFVMTGIAIVIYLNQYPNQPRERDYAYAGSFYAFSIWLGLGVLAIIDAVKKFMPQKFAAIGIGALCLVVPGIMGMENWDDHDRSGRYTARDIAYNYLNSCEPNAILCTNGDNDTFPLWYIQDVEGVRTDVRVVNMMLFNTEWYIDQMKRKAYESEPLPLTLPEEKYRDGTNNQIYIADRIEEAQDLKLVMDFVRDENPATKLRLADGRQIDYIPARNLKIPFDTSKYVEETPLILSGEMEPEPHIDINLTGNFIMKSQMMMLDLLAHNEWKRPVYYVAGGHEDALGLEPYFYQEGFAHRVVPVKTDEQSRFLDYGGVNLEAMYESYMEKFRWGNMDDPDVYLDYYTRRTLNVIRVRNNFARLALGLIENGRVDSAVAVVDRCFELLPPEKLRYDIYSTRLVEAYYRAGQVEKANEVATEIMNQVDKELHYYFSLRGAKGKSTEMDKRQSLQILQELVNLARSHDQVELRALLDPMFTQYYQQFLGEFAPAG